MMELVRNPSPPPEILNNEDLIPDRIGNSVYSKKWIYETLMSIFEFCDKSDNKEQMDESELNNDMVELDPKVEEIACSLWDMSTNQEVTQFLDETGVPAMCLDIIVKTKSPRLLEIVIGILGNMSSFDDACQSIAKNTALVKTLISLSGTSDTPTLFQVLRVYICAVVNKNCKCIWLQYIEEESYFMENLKFILENNLNGKVLKSVFELLTYILVGDKKYCGICKEASWASAILDAGHQLLKQAESLSYLFTNLSLICQYSGYEKQFVKQIEKLNPIFFKFILYSAEDDVLVDETNLSPICLCYEVFGKIITSKDLSPDLILKSSITIKAISKCYDTVTHHIANVGKLLEGDDPENPECAENSNSQSVVDTTALISKLQDLTDVAERVLNVSKHLLLYVEEVEDRKLLEDILQF